MSDNLFSSVEAPEVELTPEQLRLSMRITRGYLLNECDWTQLVDNTLTPEERAQWAAYRQQLRDITNDPAWPDVPWPAKPWEITLGL
jgi:hypothetical protein